MTDRDSDAIDRISAQIAAGQPTAPPVQAPVQAPLALGAPQGPPVVPQLPAAPPAGNDLTSPGRWIQALGNVLSLPRNALYAGPGALLNRLGLTDSTGAQGYTDFMLGRGRAMQGPLAPATLGAPWGPGFQRLPQGVQTTAFEALTDPLNALAGSGLWRNALQARAIQQAGLVPNVRGPVGGIGPVLNTVQAEAIRRGIPQSQLLDELVRALPQTPGNQLLRAGQAADEGVQQALMLPFQLAGRGITGGLRAIPAGLPGRQPIQVWDKRPDLSPYTRDAQNMLDVLTATPRRLLYRERLNNLKDVVNMLQATGHQLGLDVQDLAGPSRFQFKNWKDAYTQYLRLSDALSARIKNSPDVNEQLYGIFVLDETERRVARVWENVAIAVQDGRRRGLAGKDLADLQARAITQGFGEVLDALAMSQRVLDNVKLRPSLEIDPALLPQVQAAASQAARQIWGARRGLQNKADELPRDVFVRFSQIWNPNNPASQPSVVYNRMDSFRNQLAQADQTLAGLLGDLYPETRRLFTQRVDQLQRIRKGINDDLYSADVPSRLAPSARLDAKNFLRAHQDLQNDLKYAEATLKQVWARFHPDGTPFPEVFSPNREDWLKNVNDVLARLQQRTGQSWLPQNGTGQVTNAAELLEVLRGRVEAKRFNQLEKKLTRWAPGDIFTADPYDLALAGVSKALAAEYQLHPATSIGGRVYQGINDLFLTPWKAQQLLSPAYLLTNLISMGLMSGSQGVNPWRILTNLRGTIGARWAGQEMLTPQARQLIEDFGVQVPFKTQSGSALLPELTPISQYAGRDYSALDRVGAPGLAVAGGGLGAASGYLQSDDDNAGVNTLLGAGIGAGAGAVTPTAARYLLTRLGGAIEAAGRETAWATGFERAVSDRGIQRLNQIMADALKERPAQLKMLQEATLGKIAQDEIDVVNLGGRGGQFVPLWKGNPAPPEVIAHLDHVEPGWRVRGLPAGKRVFYAEQDGGPLTPEAVAMLNAQYPDWATKPYPALTPGDPKHIFQVITPSSQKVTRSRTPAAARRRAQSAITASQGRISPEQLEEALTAGGITPERARAYAQQWREFLDEASQEGLALANRINFDYDALNNAQALAREISPFATWAMKAFPFFIENLAAHPGVANATLGLMDESRREQEARGLTGRFAGTMAYDEMSKLWSLLLGRPVETFGNPLTGLVPFADVSRVGGNEDASLPKRLFETVSALGLGLRPDAELLLRLSGLFGDDAPARGYLRWAAPIQGATALAGVNKGRGIDLNAPFVKTEQTVRDTFSGGEVVPDLDTQAVLKRIDELALAQTGKTTGSGDPQVAKYTLAKVQQRGPIWEQAQREVARERGLRGLSGFALGQSFTPRAILPAEEARVREARRGLVLRPDEARRLQQQVKADPTAPADPALLERLRAAATEISQANGLPDIHPTLAALLDQGRVSDAEQVRQWVYNWQVSYDPAIQTYTGGGSPQETQLANLLALQSNFPALFLADPKNAGMLPPDDVLSNLQVARSFQEMGLSRLVKGGQMTGPLGQNRQYRESLQGQFPLLGEYLTYQQGRAGTGSFEDFFENRRRGTLAGNPAAPEPTLPDILAARRRAR